MHLDYARNIATCDLHDLTALASEFAFLRYSVTIAYLVWMFLLQINFVIIIVSLIVILLIRYL